MAVDCSGYPEDYYIVVNHFGRFGTAFAETDLDRANYETTIADLMSGPALRSAAGGIIFNPETVRSEDVLTPSRRKSSAASLKVAACRHCWRTLSTAMSARIVSLRCGWRWHKPKAACRSGLERRRRTTQEQCQPNGAPSISLHAHGLVH